MVVLVLLFRFMYENWLIFEVDGNIVWNFVFVSIVFFSFLITEVRGFLVLIERWLLDGVKN